MMKKTMVDLLTIQHVLDVTEDKTIAGSTSSTVTTKRRAVVVAATKEFDTRS